MANALAKAVTAGKAYLQFGGGEQSIKKDHTPLEPLAGKQTSAMCCASCSTNLHAGSDSNSLSEPGPSDTSTPDTLIETTRFDAAFAGPQGAKAFAALDPDVYNKAIEYPVAKSALAFIELTQGPSAIILAGPEEVPFTVPMNLLLNYSKVAERTVRGGFAESRKNIIRQPDDDAETVGLFVIWMLQGELRVMEVCREGLSVALFMGGTQEPYETYVKACLLLCKLYILVDKLMSQYSEHMEAEILAELARVVYQSEVYHGDRTAIVPSTVLQVYRNTMEGSALRRFVLDTFCSKFARMYEKFPGLDEYAECMEEYPKDFGVEAIKRIITGFRYNEY